jgi:hypothetical protein
MHSWSSLEMYSRICSAALSPVSSPHYKVNVHKVLCGLRLMIDLSSSALSLIGGFHIGARALLDSKCDKVWLYRSPIPVERGVVVFWFK